MRKVFVEQVTGDKIVLTGDDHAHLAYSMRSRVGDDVIVCCNKTEYSCVIERITKDETCLTVISSKPTNSEPDIEVTLFPAILKGDKLEFVIQKCTELGVDHFIPYVSKNCECRPTAVRIDRLKKIAEEASKQSGRGAIPTIDNVIDFKQILPMLENFDLVIFPYEHSKEVDLKTFLEKQRNAKKIAVIVGSEGGFAPEEVDLLQGKNIVPLTLGRRILRAETASVSVVSVIMYEMGEWRV